MVVCISKIMKLFSSDNYFRGSSNLTLLFTLGWWSSLQGHLGNNENLRCNFSSVSFLLYTVCTLFFEIYLFLTFHCSNFYSHFFALSLFLLSNSNSISWLQSSFPFSFFVSLVINYIYSQSHASCMTNKL